MTGPRASLPEAMAQPARRPATYEDLLAVPDHQVAEIVHGELTVSPRPAPRHAWAASVLGGDLVPAFNRGRGGPGGWRIVDEPELHLGQHVLVPDLGGWRRTRMPALPSEPFFTLAPDWICEVLSPSTTRFDRVRKLPIYAEYEVSHAWLVDPLARTLEIYRLENRRWILVATHGDDELVRAEPFEAIELELAAWWDDGVGP